MDDRRFHRDHTFLDGMRRDRSALHEQLRQSRMVIEESRELLKQLDEMIAKAENKRWGD
jgi:hypothetical protein